MKKYLFFALSALALNTTTNAQVNLLSGNSLPASTTENAVFNNLGNAQANKTTGLSDTLYFIKTQNQTVAANQNALFYDFAQPLDSGYIYGTDAQGLKAFAELYRYASIDNTTPADTTYNILGFLARFSGKAVSATKSVTFSVWKRDTNKNAIAGRTKYYVYGTPLSTTVATVSKPITSLALNTIAPYYLATPLTGVNYDVYVGYSLYSYSWSALGGDTIGLYSTTNSVANNITVESGTLDTLVSANNLVMNSSNAWKSVVYDLRIGNAGEQVILPIIKLNCAKCWPTAINGFKHNNLTFFGNFPNPAVNNTTIRLSLKNNTDVAVQIMDITGKTVKTIEAKGLTSGINDINIETAPFAAGNYTYLVTTSEGDAVASQMTIIK